jgi:SAM-dependent methyltransferase
MTPVVGRETDCNACGGRDLEPLRHQPGLRIAAEGLEARFDVRSVLCRRCGLVFTSPQPDPELLARFYARQHRELFANPDPASGALRIPGQGSRRDQLAWLAARLGDLRGLRVLEVGCYEGYLLSLLAGRGARCVGVEPCEAAAELGRSRFGVDIRTGMLDQLELGAASFDLAILSHVAEHLADPLAALARCHALLRPGGRLFVEVPNVLAPRARHVVDFFTFDHLFNFSPRTLTRLGARAGFEALEVDADFPFPAFRWLARAVDARPAPQEIARPDPVAVEECRRAARGYAAARERFLEDLRARLAPRLADWTRRGARIALYGAGAHTEHLLAVTGLGRAAIAAVLDGDPAKRGGRCQGHPIVAPDELPSLGVEAVVISSYDFQAEMAEAVEKLCSPPPEVVTLYDRVEAFSSWRGAAAGPA